MPFPLTLSNFLLFQLGWFACVLGGAGPWWLVGSLAALAVVGWHVARAAERVFELRLLLVALLFGVVWESLLVATGVLEYSHGQLLGWLAPVWIIIMWPLFATTLNVSMRWLKKSWLMAVVMGAVGGPLAFLAGRELGAVEMPDPQLAVIVLAIGWGIMMPLLMRISLRFDGFKPLLKGGDA